MLKLFLSFLIFSQAAHVSFTSIECFPSDGIIKVFIRQSQSDFVYDYRYTIDDDLNISLSSEIDTSVIFVSKYLATRLHISVDKDLLSGKITKLGWDNSGFTADLTYHFKNKKARAFKVKNTFFNGIRQDPSNLVIFKYNDYEEGVKFNLEKTENLFSVK